MGRVFILIYGLFKEQRLAFIAFMLLLTGSIAWFGSKITFEEDIHKVIPSSEKNDKLITVLRNSKFAERMVFCVSMDSHSSETDPGLLISYAGSLVDSLNGDRARPLIRKIEDRFSPGSMSGIYNLFYRNLPLFLDNKDYSEIEDKLVDTEIRQAIKQDYEALITPGGFAMRDPILKDPLSLTPIALKKLERLKVSDNFEIYQDYIFSEDKRNLLFFVIPGHPSTETSKNAELLDMIDRFKASLDSYYHGEVECIYFGSMAISIGNATQIKRDIYMTVSIAVLLLLIFLGIYFHKRISFLLLFLPALMGGGFAIAMLTLIKGEVSAISLGLGSVMLGISIDYALHFLSHLRHTGSVKTVISDISGPVMTSSITTASAFLCLLVLKSEALRDLGLFAALSVFSSAIFTLVILPQFFKDRQASENKARKPWIVTKVEQIASYAYDRNPWLGRSIFVLLLLFVFSFAHVKFEPNMDSMNYMSNELKDAENYLDSISSYKLQSVFLVSTAPQLNDALILNEALQTDIDSLYNKGIVKDYTSVHTFYPSTLAVASKIDKWKDFWHPERSSEVKKTIISASREYGFKEDAFADFYGLMEFDVMPEELSLEHLREAFLDEYITEKDHQAMVTSILKVQPENKADIYTAFQDREDLLVFDRQSLTSSFMEGLRDDFDKLIIISLLIVFIILTVSFGRIELGIITFIPLLISWVWTLGIMGLLGIRFNIFNIVISTFIFGLGIDYAIFCMRGLVQEYQYGRKKLNSYKTSILLSGITTVVGIGVLIFAKHPALQSIAISAIIGILSVILITYSLLPRLFRFLIEHEGKSRKWPATLTDFIFSLNTAMIFLVGVILLIISRFILQYLVPLKKKQKKLIFHKILSFSTSIIVYGSVNIRLKTWNRSNEDFKEPAIVICNHQSHLDTVLTMMLNPKMILLTNPWVQKSIFYRGFISYADFYSVGEGSDKLKVKIRKLINEGYSVLYFPEGTRSPDLEIGRFHQGAFHMARELNLDILPIIIYGTGNAMPKFEPFLKTTPVSLTILPRISPDHSLIKDTPLTTSKAFRQYYKEEYGRIRDKIETPAFYRKKLVRNYLYRSPILEWYMKVKIRMDGHYVLFDRYLPKDGMITDVGCGYGFMAYMLQMMSPKRIFRAYDFDRNKIDTANNCALKNEHINFTYSDITNTEFEQSDAFLLVDVLHYLPVEKQEELIRNCVASLNDQGVIIIRDADTSMRSKHRGTRVSEFLSTGTGFNKTWNDEKILFFNSKERYLQIFSQNMLDVTIVDETKMTSNLIYILKKKV